MISMYRHDATIRLEPPVVDMDRRKANALAAFNKEVQLADQHCRNTVIKLLQTGREGMPFRYKFEGGPWPGVLGGMHGTFVPPHSLHNVLEGVERHGGGSELVVIGSDAWGKGPSHDWRKVDAKRSWKETGQALTLFWVLVSGIEPPILDDFLDGAVSHVGMARCPSRGGEAGGQVEYYEYDLYRDVIEGRLRVATQRIYTGPDGARPLKLETIGALGQVTQVQTRTYMPGLVIEPPTAAAK
jgi:hypothetical protein